MVFIADLWKLLFFYLSKSNTYKISWQKWFYYDWIAVDFCSPKLYTLSSFIFFRRANRSIIGISLQLFVAIMKYTRSTIGFIVLKNSLTFCYSRVQNVRSVIAVYCAEYTRIIQILYVCCELLMITFLVKSKTNHVYIK